MRTILQWLIWIGLSPFLSFLNYTRFEFFFSPFYDIYLTPPSWYFSFFLWLACFICISIWTFPGPVHYHETTMPIVLMLHDLSVCWRCWDCSTRLQLSKPYAHKRICMYWYSRHSRQRWIGLILMIVWSYHISECWHMQQKI